MKSVIPVVVSDKSAKISDNQGHLTKMLVNSSFVAFDNHESDPSSSLITDYIGILPYFDPKVAKRLIKTRIHCAIIIDLSYGNS